MFAKRYADVFTGDEHCSSHSASLRGATLRLEGRLHLCRKNPPYSSRSNQPIIQALKPGPIPGLTCWPVFPVISITTDHISPAGIYPRPARPQVEYLQSLGVQPEDCNSYGSPVRGVTMR